MQVMIDSDLAELYGVETKQINRAVKRNIKRFPKDFMFQLTSEELEILRSQFAISNEELLRCQNGTSINRALKPKKTDFYEDLRCQNSNLSETPKRGQISRSQFVTLEKGGRTYLPYAFTEQGVAMLSSVLRSETAVGISVQIIRVFIAMKKFISKNAEVFSRLDNVERKQIEYQIKSDKNFEKVFNAIEDKTIQKSKGIFFEDQIFDAYKFVADLIRTAKKSIILIDNYVDDSVLTLFSKNENQVKVIIYTNYSKQLELDLKKFNSQYNPIEIKAFDKSHDRFMIIDDKEVYHFGASLKDLGKKWFAFSKFDKGAVEILWRLN